MAFVKLDSGLLDSSLWTDRDARDAFLTALLMAVPYELTAPAMQLPPHGLTHTGYLVPVGWYGLVKAAGIGICSRAGLDRAVGMAALTRLGSADFESRSVDHDGRRLARISGGWLVLNWAKYRERDMTTAERSKRWRERQLLKAPRQGAGE